MPKPKTNGEMALLIGGAGLIGLHMADSFRIVSANALSGVVEAIGTGLDWATTAALVGGSLYVGARLAAARRDKTEEKAVRLVPRVTTEMDRQAIRQMIVQMANLRRSRFHRLLRGREWFRFVVHYGPDGIAFYVSAPADRIRPIANAWLAAYPEAEAHAVGGLPPLAGYQVHAAPLFKGGMAGLPFRPFENGSTLVDVIAQMEPGAWMEITFSPGSWLAMKRQVKQALASVQGGEWANDPDNKARQKAINKRFTGREGVLETAVTLGAPDPVVLQSMGVALASAMSYDNGLRFRHYWFMEGIRNWLESAIPFPLKGRRFLLTSDELANMVHLPPGNHPLTGAVTMLEDGERSLEDGELSEGIMVGRLRHPIQPERPVCIPREQFTKHFFLSGRTGMGKTSTAVQMVQSMIDDWLADPDNAPGFTYFDPARETAAIILSRLLKAEAEGKHVPWDKVHYFYLGPTDYPIGLNLLHKDGRPTDVIAKEAAGLIRFAYSAQAPKMERILENALLTLMEDNRPHTLLGVVPLLMDESFQRRIVPRVSDPIIQEFWALWEEERNRVQSLDSLLNRLSPLRTNPTMRRMFGQSRWSLDIRKYMDAGHIVLFDLLNVAPDDIKLTVGHIINQYHVNAKRRSTGAKLHVMFVDEAHLVQIPVMSKIIAEDRKFGLSLGLITQYLGQFDQWLVDSITENMGTIISCAQGEQSAPRVEKMTNGAFSREMLQGLPERVAAVYTATKIDGRSTAITCLVESDPPVVYLPDGSPAAHTSQFQMKRALTAALEKGKELQRRDGLPAARIDEEINAYLKPKTILQEVKHRETSGNPNEFWTQ